MKHLSLITAGLGGILLGGVLIAGPGPASAAATPEAQPTQLSLKPVNQPGLHFDLSLEPGQTQEYEVELANHGAKPIAAKTYAADAYSLTNGGLGVEYRDGESSQTTTWLSYPTEALELEPGQANVRTFKITVPTGTLPGQYITGLVLENDVPVEDSGSIALNEVIRQAVAVSIRVPGPLEPAFEFGSADHTITAKYSVVGVELINTGNANLKPAGEMTIRDASGNAVSEEPITMASVYSHNATRVETTLARILVPGDYTLDITLTDAATKTTSTGTALPFTITADEVENARTAQSAPLLGITQDIGPDILPYLIGMSVIGGLAALVLLFRRLQTASMPPRRSVRTRRDRSSGRRH